jgi:hypothetical protein
VNDAEADLLLATHDPLSALAEFDKEKLGALLQQVQAQHEPVVKMLEELAKQTDLTTEVPQKDNAVKLPPERFEIVVECTDEKHQRAIFDQLTGEGLRCRVLTF